MMVRKLNKRMVSNMEFEFWVYSKEIAKDYIKRLIKRGYTVNIRPSSVGYDLKVAR